MSGSQTVVHVPLVVREALQVGTRIGLLLSVYQIFTKIYS